MYTTIIVSTPNTHLILNNHSARLHSIEHLQLTHERTLGFLEFRAIINTARDEGSEHVMFTVHVDAEQYIEKRIRKLLDKVSQKYTGFNYTSYIFNI